MMKTSVYGGAGFIGGSYCRLYPDDVVKIKRESREPETNEVLYFISTTSNYNVLESLHKDVDVNLTVMLEVLEHCKDKDITFNYISSGFVYGNDVIDAKEDDYCDPRGFYSITKRAAEMLLVSFCETFNVNYRIMRIANVYGTEDKDASGKKNALGHLVNQLKENNEINLYDGGDVLRDYLHVDDISRAVNLIINKGELNSIYNIASGKPKKFYDIIMYAKQYLGSERCINAIEPPDLYKKVQAKNFSLNIDKLKALGFSEKMSLEEGLELLCR